MLPVCLLCHPLGDHYGSYGNSISLIYITVSVDIDYLQKCNDEFEERLQLFYRESGFDYSAYSSPTDDEWEDLLLRERADREAERMVGHGE